MLAWPSLGTIFSRNIYNGVFGGEIVLLFWGREKCEFYGSFNGVWWLKIEMPQGPSPMTTPAWEFFRTFFSKAVPTFVYTFRKNCFPKTLFLRLAKIFFSEFGVVRGIELLDCKRHGNFVKFNSLPHISVFDTIS